MRSDPAIVVTLRPLDNGTTRMVSAGHGQPVEELRNCPFGPEHVKGRPPAMLGNDLVLALGL
jgi:hypothetical protein